MTSADVITSLDDEAARVQEDALFSARGHFEAGRAWKLWHYLLGIPATGLAAVSSGTAITSHTRTAAAIGLIVAALTALLVFLNPSEKAQQQQSAGTRFNRVRNRARRFREIELKSGRPVSELIERLHHISDQRDDLNESSPAIPRSAFRRAKRGIEAGEATYSVDEADATD